MPALVPVQTNFTSGEISPRLRIRRDVNKLRAGVLTMKNYIMSSTGAAVRRTGTRYVAETKDSSKQSALIKFEFSVFDVYCMELGDNYVRWFRNRQQIQVEDNGGASITNGDFPTDLSGWTTVAGSPAHTSSVGGGAAQLPSGAAIRQSVAISSPNAVHVLKFRVYSEPVALEVGTTSGGSDLVDRTGSRRCGVGWHTVEFTPGVGTVYIEFTSSGSTGQVDDVALLSDEPLELESPYTEDLVSDIKWAQSADTMYLTQRDTKIYKVLRYGNRSWSLEEVNLTLGGSPTPTLNSTSNDYPRAVTFYENRLIFGGTDNQPQTFWGSKAADFEDFTVGANADDAFQFTLSADDVNIVRWFNPGKQLIIGASNGEFSASGEQFSDPITPTSINVKRETTNGSNASNAIRVDNSVLFVQRSGHKIREFVYKFEVDSYVSVDLTILAEHLFRTPQITRLAFARNPSNLLWATSNDGKLYGMTFERDENVVGWHQHVFGGTDVACESVATLPTEDQDEVWCIVKRTINGTTRRYVEFFTDDYPIDDTAKVEDGVFSDCCLVFDSPGSTTLSGLDHLEGEDVSVLADGGVIKGKSVNGGEITLSNLYSKVVVGLDYESILKTFPIDLETSLGPTQTKQKSITDVEVYLHNTTGLIYSVSDSTKEYRIPFRETSDPMNAPVPLYSGLIEAQSDGGWRREQYITFKQNQPLPSTILGFVTWMRAGAL